MIRRLHENRQLALLRKTPPQAAGIFYFNSLDGGGSSRPQKPEMRTGSVSATVLVRVNPRAVRSLGGFQIIARVTALITGRAITNLQIDNVSVRSVHQV